MNPGELRRAFAEEVRAVAHLGDDPAAEALIDALAGVPREQFLGPGPWQIAQPLDPATPYRTTPDARPEHLYHDVVVAIDPARQLNNGQPSALARWIAAAAPRAGDSVLHVGCGTGYYTAVIAELVGPAGRVLGLDIDADLAARAAVNLAPWPQARAACGDGSAPGGPHDAIFVNAGATHPRAEWLAALAPGGRLVLPLTVHLPGMPHGVGFVVRIERPAAGDRWPARVVSPVGIYDCAGARDPDAEAQLRGRLAPGGPPIAALDVGPHPRGDRCLVHVAGACLQA